MAGDNQKLTRRRALCLLGAPVFAGATGVGFASARDPGNEIHATHDHALLARRGGSTHAGYAGSGSSRSEGQRLRPGVRSSREYDWRHDHSSTRATRVLREWELIAQRQGVPGRTGRRLRRLDVLQRRVPGPTLRAHEGDLLGIRFLTRPRTRTRFTSTGSTRQFMDGVPGMGPRQGQTGRERLVRVRRSQSSGSICTTASAGPPAAHIAKGRRGTLTIDPKKAARRGRRARDGDERVRHELRPERTRCYTARRGCGF